jgi:hypothetical protein
MDKRSLSGTKLKLILLLDEARQVVRFASVSECDSLFFVLADFTAKALDFERPAASSDNAQAISVCTDISRGQDQKCCCEAFSFCDPSSRDSRRCRCCDQDSKRKHDLTAYDEDVFCAECLCNLLSSATTDLFELGGSL